MFGRNIIKSNGHTIKRLKRASKTFAVVALVQQFSMKSNP